jgi:hypothetical protein
MSRLHGGQDACGRFLPQKSFSLEHLVPQQALKQDPDAVQTNPETPKNVRARTLLICNEPLRRKGVEVYKKGCNSWKGRFYDKPISDFFSGKALQSAATTTDTHIIAALSLAYLAMVAEFGYVVALMRSGLLMRQQFFSPRKFHRELPGRSQIVLGGGLAPAVRLLCPDVCNSSFECGTRFLSVMIVVSLWV